MPSKTHIPRRLLVTGGAGFIGINFVQWLLAEQPDMAVLNLDALTYAGNAARVDELTRLHPGRHQFVKADIRDAGAVRRVVGDFKPDTIVNFAAESHVDRSIDNPLSFVESNVLGVAVLLEAARKLWGDRQDVRFHQISTDEVYGTLGEDGRFSEQSPYDPSSPYSASKAAADHLVLAWRRTYGLPVTVSNSSNNYGPWQFPEKLIPLMICCALADQPLPVYGSGANVRDWLHVEDHARAIWAVLSHGIPGQTYMVGGDSPCANVEVVNRLCALLDAKRPRPNGRYADLIQFVSDRPGHDIRYAVDCSRIRSELGWTPRHTFDHGLAATIDWYLAHQDWVHTIRATVYDGGRLGLPSRCECLVPTVYLTVHAAMATMGGENRGNARVDGPSLSHIDERLGHVAIDMGLLKPEQVSDIQLRVVMSRAGNASPITFGEAATELGYIDWKGLEALEAEERRRRRLINGYEIIDIIGAGTIATAYHAMQLAMEREVALKILHPRLASDPVFVRAYIAEAQAVSRFHHPNIVQGIDAGESNGFYYFAHEYLSGGSMADKLQNGTAKFSENRLLRYLRQTTGALKHAWAVAVYHGDINPGNLLLDGQGNIKLANLGVPRVAGIVEEGKRRAPGFVRCGPEYAAPEQLENPELVNARTDMYNLGATFYHISFGIPPFHGRSREEIVAARATNPIPLFTLKEQENFSGKYLRLLHDMLEVDPKLRPADPEELESRLEKFHIAGADELSGLARQVRQVGGPVNLPGVSGRTSVSARLPQADSKRQFRLRRRTGPLKRARWIGWMRLAVVALLALLAIYLLAF